MNYIVMECHPGYAVLLDEDGRFIKAANFHYEVGDTVTDPVPMRETRPRHRRRSSPWAYATGVMAACLTLVLGLLLYQTYTTPVSSIVLRINPEVRMGLNEQGKVVSLDALNDDARTLLNGYSSRGKDSLTVTDELIDRAIELGFLSDGGKVSLSIDTPDDAGFEAYSTALQQGVAEHLEGRISVTIEIYDAHDLPPEEESPPVTVPVDPAPDPDDDDDDDDDHDDDDDDDDDDHDDHDDDHDD